MPDPIILGYVIFMLNFCHFDIVKSLAHLPLALYRDTTITTCYMSQVKKRHCWWKGSF